MKPGALWDQQEGGNFVQDGGAKCVNLCVVSDGFGISVFGLQTRNFHPRGSGKGGGVGGGSKGWQHRGPE